VSAPVGVVGGGSFGVALATAISRKRREAIVWSRGARDLHLPGVRSSSDMAELTDCELIFIAVPSMHVPTLSPLLGAELDGRHLLVHVSRGLIGDELRTVSRHLRDHTPARRVGCLAGPINPQVLAEAIPGGGIVGTGFPEVVEAVRDAIAGPEVRLYDSADTTGVEVASAMVGLLALAAGFCFEKKISPAAMAIMMNRGLAEAARVGVKLGADAATFHGMAGAGDLFAAVGGDERAEVRLGRAIARTDDLAAAGKEAGAHIEGLSIARRVSQYAERVGVEAPISAAMAVVLGGEEPVERALAGLMRR
jgi:glycerol-3-phosphate dehydrogenase (NAD(P)+)